MKEGTLNVRSPFSPDFNFRPLEVRSLGGHLTPGHTDSFQDGESFQKRKDRIIGNYGEDLNKFANIKQSNPIAIEIEVY